MRQSLSVRAVFLNGRNKFVRTLSTSTGSPSNIADNVEEYADPKSYLDFKKYLNSNKIPFKDGYTCLQLACKLCGKEDKEAYVNKRTGIFLCAGCDIKRNISTITDFYEKGIIKDVKIPFHNDFRSTLADEFTEITQDVCDNLKIRGLEFADLKGIGSQYAVSHGILSIPLKNVAGKIVGEKMLHIVTRKEETFPSTNCSGLLIYGPSNKNKAVVVSSVVDFLVLLTQRMENYCIICLPYFLNTLPQECLPGLERFKELILWFNFQSADWDVTKNFSRKLNENRCFLIRPTDTEPAPAEAHRRRLNLRHILHKATAVRHKSITTFESLKNDIWSELQNIDKVNGVKWKRFPILNSKLKGHRKGELTILTGPTGSGKTTFMSEYSLDLALQGVTTLWGSFEIRNTRLAATLLRQFVGYPLEGKLNEFEHWTKEFQKYPLYFMTFQGQQPLKVVMEAIEHAQYIHDINHVIIDNLQFMMGVSGSIRTDKFWEQDNIIASFRTFATKSNVHVTLVMHPRKEREDDELTTSSVFGSAKATQEADNVLIIQDKRLTSVRGKKYLQIAKNRYSGDLGVMPMEFDKESLSYASCNKKKKREV